MTQMEKWNAVLEQLNSAKVEKVIVYHTATNEEIYRGTLQGLTPPYGEVDTVMLEDLQPDRDGWAVGIIGVKGLTAYTYVIAPEFKGLFSATAGE